MTGEDRAPGEQVQGPLWSAPCRPHTAHATLENVGLEVARLPGEAQALVLASLSSDLGITASSLLQRAEAVCPSCCPRLPGGLNDKRLAGSPVTAKPI